MNRDDNHPSNEYRHQCYCIAIGSLIGIFIQLSSLCSNTRDFVLLLSARQSQQLQMDHDNENNDNDGDNHIPASSSFNEEFLQPEFNSWKFGWSIITTTMGIMLLLTLRALIVIVLTTYKNYTTSPHHNIIPNMIIKEFTLAKIRNMEQNVATGTLWGVSMAWVITDYILGFSIPHTSSTDLILRTNMHVSSTYWYVPMVVSGIALFAWHMVVRFLVNIPTTADDDDEECCDNVDNVDDQVEDTPYDAHGLRQPLLVNVEKESHVVTDNTLPRHRTVQLLSLGSGMMLGIFIQCSTLGVSYMGKFVSYSRTIVLSSFSANNGIGSLDIADPLSSTTMQLFEDMAIGSSFIMSCLGLILLLCVRAIVTHMIMIENDPFGEIQSMHDCNDDIQREESGVVKSTDTSTIPLLTPTETESVQTFVLLHVEAYMATGTVIGLNLAWMMTDVTLFTIPLSSILPHSDFNVSHYWYQSLFTLIVSALWCPLLLYCTGLYSVPPEQSNTRTSIDNDNDDEIDNERWIQERNQSNNHMVVTIALEEIMTPTTISRVPVPINQYEDEEMGYM